MGPEIAAAGPEPSPARPVPAAEPAPSPARPAPAAEPEPPAARQAAAAEPARAEESRADVTVRAGESAIFHDGSGSLTLRLRFDGLCSGDGIVEVRRKGGPRRRLVGSGAVIVRLQEREGTYLVRCQGDAPGDKPRASGVLALRRDSGNVPLPRRAPTNVIDADGRRYTVLFQTRPPTLTLAWPKAPGGTEGVELHLQSASGERLIPAGAARHQLASGALAEGTHTFWYTTGEGYASPRSTVTLRFDNTAPTAQFFRATSAPESPDGIQVDGVTIEGAKVSASGAPLPVDDQGRFRAEVAPLPGDDAVAVRLEHPRGGVHYYIRRRSGAATR
jgi:hypothetical protein